jgi:hypothetical protein
VTRRLAAIALGVLLVAALAFVRAQDDGCPDGWVMYEDDCTIANELVVMTSDGQVRADVEAAIASSNGKIVFAVDDAGIYTVRYPVEDPEDLAPLKEALELAGFHVAYQTMVELYADG